MCPQTRGAILSNRICVIKYSMNVKSMLVLSTFNILLLALVNYCSGLQSAVFVLQTRTIRKIGGRARLGGFTEESSACALVTSFQTF